MPREEVTLPLIITAFLLCVFSGYTSFLSMEDSWCEYTISSYSGTVVFLPFSCSFLFPRTSICSSLWASLGILLILSYNCPKRLQDLLWLLIATSQSIIVYVNLRLFSKAHYLLLSTLSDGILSQIYAEIFLHHLEAVFPLKLHLIILYPPFPGHPWIIWVVLALAVISFPMKIHYIFLHFHWEAVYKERHLMQFVHGIACMCRWARASLKAQVTSVSFVLMSWTSLSIPDGKVPIFRPVNPTLFPVS